MVDAFKIIEILNIFFLTSNLYIYSSQRLVDMTDICNINVVYLFSNTEKNLPEKTTITYIIRIEKGVA